MSIYNLRCFGTSAGTGNEALVVVNDATTPIERQIFARQQKKPACIFMQTDTLTDRIILDFYYPHTRSPLCLHGTLAAAKVYFEMHPDITDLTVITSVRQQQIPITISNGNIFIRVAEQPAITPVITDGVLERLLNINITDIVTSPVVKSVGSPKLLIEVKNSLILESLNPNLELIVQWGKANAVNGCYVFAKLNSGNFVGRNFNHLNPVNEDSATGVAAGALAAHVKQDIKLSQGDYIGNPCIISACYEDKYILISGRVDFL